MTRTTDQKNNISQLEQDFARSQDEIIRLRADIAEAHIRYDAQRHAYDQARLNFELMAESFRSESCRLFEETVRLSKERRLHEKACAERDKAIARLQADKSDIYHEAYQLFHELNGYKVHSKNLEAQLEAQFAAQKVHSKNLEAHLTDQMGHVKRLQEENAALQETISYQRRSLVWLMTTLLGVIYNRALPPGCLTRRIMRRTYTVLSTLLIHRPLWLCRKAVSLISGKKGTLPPLPRHETAGENDGIPEADSASDVSGAARDGSPDPESPACEGLPTPSPHQTPDEPASPTLPGRTWYPLSFPIFEDIEVSIIIPVYNKSEYTFRCLCSIFENSVPSYEVIVVDNASSDETPQMLEAMQGLRVIRNEENEGFVAACNRGADAARGSRYLFLNNDTEVGEGWLEAILAPLRDGKVGIVGAKLIYPNGKLQEAGCIIWQDATGWQYGRCDDPDLPQYNYRREVDYCSGACLLIRKELWLRLGGFDIRYAPAYYEDTDLCFGARKLGYKVIYQPECRITHYEGITAGTDTTRGYKSYQQVNYSKFKEKWREVLETCHHKGPEELYLARERSVDKKILIVDHYFPTFDMDSGSLRMFSIVKILAEMGHKVIFWPDNLCYHERYGAELQRLGVEAIYGEFNFVEFMKEYGKHIHLAILSRPHIAINYVYAVKNFSNAQIVYDTVDLSFLREERKARIDLLTAGRDAKRTELLLTYLSQRTLVVSPIEEKILGEMGFSDKVSILPNVHTPEPVHNPFERRHGLMFIGGFMHQPNEDGVIWFVERILPLIRKEISEAKFYIVGSHPSDAVKALASPDIVVTGYVEDVSPFFEETRVFVSPLRYGAGIKGKIGQSMSYGLPVVTTSIGAEGMGLVDGHNSLICDDEEEFAKKVIEVYNNRELWMHLSQNGTEHVMRHFSPEAVKVQLQALLQ